MGRITSSASWKRRTGADAWWQALFRAVPQPWGVGLEEVRRRTEPKWEDRVGRSDVRSEGEASVEASLWMMSWREDSGTDFWWRMEEREECRKGAALYTGTMMEQEKGGEDDDSTLDPADITYLGTAIPSVEDRSSDGSTVIHWLSGHDETGLAYA